MYIFLFFVHNIIGDNMKDQKIKCDVTNCKYNDASRKLCDLSEIEVSCSCDACDCHSNRETICASFKEGDK